jgi:signal peptidase I
MDEPGERASGTSLAEPAAAPGPAAPGGRTRRAGGARPLAEFLVLLGLGIVLARAFAVEAYIVPTGSMAPTLLGAHRDVLCPTCGAVFALGLDDGGQSGRPVCPNCGEEELAGADSADGAGDRLLVQKFLFDLRPPRRWEIAVFQSPEDPGEAFVKRIVGLPGESIEIAHGDIWIDGQVARKTLEEQRALRVLVHDHDHRPGNADRFPRWVVRPGDGRRGAASGWRAEGTGFAREPAGPEGPGAGIPPTDWLEYRHWQPERMAPGPVRDFVAYNGGDDGSENRVDDLMVEADVAPGPGCRALRVRFGWGRRRVLVTIPTGPDGPPSVLLDGGEAACRDRGVRLEAGPPGAGFRRLEAGVFDRTLTVALDGRLLFDPIDLADLPDEPPPAGASSPLALGVEGGEARVRGLRVYRDVYYTSALNRALRRPFAVGEPYRLGPDEYFVLGDNSPVSNDSRFWSGSPVVKAEALVGKPFLVHLPSRSLPLRLPGGAVFWIPDPREIRYIR